MNVSINLTVHNRGYILHDVLNGIVSNLSQPAELVVVLDGCTDNSEAVLKMFFANHKVEGKILYADNVYETKANNMAAKASSGEYIIIVQDDDIIREKDFDLKLITPFQRWNDVFAVTGNTAHNWVANDKSLDYFSINVISDRWARTLTHCDHANANNLDEITFAVRDTVNRSPLCMNRKEFIELGMFDESFVQDCDEHDLMYRMHKQIGKVCGAVKIDVDRDVTRIGGTRDEHGNTKSWLYQLYHRNSTTLIDRHSDAMQKRTVENRKLL